VLQEQLETHKTSLKNVDESLKRLNGSENSRNNVKKELDTDKSKRNFDIKNYEERDRNRSNSARKINIPETASNRTVRESGRDLKRYEDVRMPRKRGLETNESGDEDDHKRHTIKSSVVSTSVMPIKSKEELIKLQNKYKGSEQRNKRIIGHILGTLRQFKNDDTERSTTSQAIHRKELEKKIEIKKVEDIKRIVEEKRKLEEEKYKEQQRIEIIEQKIRLAEEFDLWKKNQLQYKKFIRTKAKPFIFYLPKEHDSNSQKLLQETAALIDDQIAKKLKEIEDELEALTKRNDSLNASKTENQAAADNKENKEAAQPESDSDESELDEEKNNINLRIGDDDEEEPVVKPKADDLKAEENSNVEMLEAANEAGPSEAMESETKVDESC